MKVLFVCTGNTCRSPMAEGILRDMAAKKALDIEVRSAGISVYSGGAAARNSIDVMKQINIDISDHKSLQVNEELVMESDLVFTMSHGHKYAILSEFPLSEGKVFNLLDYAYGDDMDVSDPYGGSIGVYLEIRDEIYGALEVIVGKF